MYSMKEEVSTGVEVEKRTFTWRIKDFDVIRHSNELIQAQEFSFKAGELIGLETEWKTSLKVGVKVKNEGGDVDDGHLRNRIGIFLSCTKKPKDVKQVNGIAKYSILSTDEHQVKKFGNLQPEKIIDYAACINWGYPEITRKDEKVEDIPLIDGCLVVEIEFHLYAPTPPPAMLPTALQRTVASIQEQFEPVFMKKLQSDLKGLDISSETSDVTVKIVSKDMKEFRVSGGTLSARSPVFKTMLEVDMKEANTGIISIDDLSSKTITVLLRFIYTGMLHEDWSTPDVIVSLVYAAAKYQLSDLLEFLDSVLGKVCSNETAGKLLNLADKLGMKKAEKEILERIKKDFSSKEDIMALISSGFEFDFH